MVFKPDRQAGDIQRLPTTAAQPRQTAGSSGLGGRVLLGELLNDGIEPTPQLLDDLIYEGRAHSIAGRAGKGKTILAVCMCLQVMLLKGLPVLYLDAENGPKVIAERLHDMGADPSMLDQLFHYYPADLTLEPDSLAALRATVAVVRPALGVFDSLADFLAMADVDENSNTECTRWFANVIQPLKDADVASLLLDHLTKSGKGGPRGASSKLAKMDVQWELDVPQQFSRERTGEITLKCIKDRESWLPKTVRFSIGGGMFPGLAEAIGEPEEPLVLLNSNARKLYDTLQKAGKQGARWTDLERAVSDSKGNVTRGLEELDGYELVEREDGRYFTKGAVPKRPMPATESRSTERSHNGTSEANGTGESGTVPSGTTPLWGGTGGTPDPGTNGTNHSQGPTASLPGSTEDGDEPHRLPPHHTDDSEVGGLGSSPPSSPTLAGTAEAADTVAATTENEPYLSQHRQPPATSDESATSPTLPNNHANVVEPGRRLTTEEVAVAQRLISKEGMSATSARATVLGL